MDLTAAAGKTQESDPDSSTRIHTPKPVSFSNGVLKRNNHSGSNNNNHHGGGGGGGGVYKECLKNHAASLGAHAVDGCGEFMPSPNANSADPTSLKCAACGCHRNFHRREPEESFQNHNISTTPTLEYQPHHRHHPPPPTTRPPPPPPPGDGGSHSSPSSPSPPPISSSYYPSAPHLLLTLSGGIPVAGTSQDHLSPIGNRTSPVVNGRKRFRTRFTQDQKGKMLEFAEKLGWKMQKRDEEVIIRFCNEISVEKGVFKVWMHNNKNSFGTKKEHSSNPIPTGGGEYTNSMATTATHNGNGIAFVQNHQENQEIQNEEESGNHFHGDNNFNGRVVCPNGSSSSS